MPITAATAKLVLKDHLDIDENCVVCKTHPLTPADNRVVNRQLGILIDHDLKYVHAADACRQLARVVVCDGCRNGEVGRESQAGKMLYMLHDRPSATFASPSGSRHGNRRHHAGPGPETPRRVRQPPRGRATVSREVVDLVSDSADSDEGGDDGDQTQTSPTRAAGPRPDAVCSVCLDSLAAGAALFCRPNGHGVHETCLDFYRAFPQNHLNGDEEAALLCPQCQQIM